MEKGKVCVTGGTGFVAFRLVLQLLRSGYSVNVTVRPNPSESNKKREIGYLRKLPGASERLHIFEADLGKAGDFVAAMEACTGVFHVAHPMEGDVKPETVIKGLLGVLQASHDSKTVRRFIYTSSGTSLIFHGKDLDSIDEETWTDFTYLTTLQMPEESYAMSKTLAEQAALEFGERHGLDVVTLVPTWILGPFIHPHRCPFSVQTSLALILGDRESYKRIARTSFVHVDDVARAHIHLLELPSARGRYICSAVDVTIDKLAEFLAARHPEYQLPPAESWKGIEPVEKSVMSSKKLLETGFQFQRGLQEMFDDSIRRCKEVGCFDGRI